MPHRLLTPRFWAPIVCDGCRHLLMPNDSRHQGKVKAQVKESGHRETAEVMGSQSVDTSGMSVLTNDFPHLVGTESTLNDRFTVPLEWVKEEACMCPPMVNPPLECGNRTRMQPRGAFGTVLRDSKQHLALF